jgi:hypothetical protein
MVTPRKPTRPTVEAIDQFCAQFDDLFRRCTTREAFRQYLARCCENMLVGDGGAAVRRRAQEGTAKRARRGSRALRVG